MDKESELIHPVLSISRQWLAAVPTIGGIHSLSLEDGRSGNLYQSAHKYFGNARRGRYRSEGLVEQSPDGFYDPPTGSEGDFLLGFLVHSWQ
jgi:hypothetical protein